MIIFRTQRLSLRQFGSADSTSLMNIFGDAEVMRYGDGVRTPAWVERWILGEQRSYQARGYGKWAVVDGNQAGDHRGGCSGCFMGYCIGYCGLSYVDGIGGHPEVALGYRLARRYWGQGYASEAVKATVDYGFDVLGLERIVATIDPGNTASLRVAEKTGMVYEKDVMYPGYTHPDRVYVIEKV